MKLLIAGATGGTGRQLLTQALAAGHAVTALVRDVGRLRLSDPALTVIQGDVCDPTAAAQAVAGQDAVMVCLGAPALSRSTVRADGTRVLVQAMEAAGVRRLVCLSVLGIGDTKAQMPFFVKYLLVPFYLRRAFADHEGQEAAVRASGLDWTLVRPPFLTDGPAVGGVQHGFDDLDGLSLKISRADLAAFMLDQLADDRYVRATPGVSYAA